MELNMPLSDEELIALALAAKPNEAVPKNNQDEILQEVEYFVVANGIKEGTEHIKEFQILDLIKRTSKTKTKFRAWMKKFGTIFKKCRGEDGFYYKLNPTPFNNSLDFRFRHRKKMRDSERMKKVRYGKKIKKDKQKNQDEIPRIDAQCPPKDTMGTD